MLAMRHVPLALLTVLAATTGCGDDGTSGNPSVLWLALDGSETMTRLVGAEPSPF